MSTQATKKLYDDMDLTIFGCEDAQQCDQECDDPIAGCIVVKRLVVTVMYYGQLNVQNSADSQAIFMAFINEVYKDILDDYAHLVKKHNNLEDINKALKEKKVFGACDATKCSFTSRHQSRHTTNTKPSKTSMDAVVHFYAQVVDSLHFYLLHLFECGFRMEQASPNDIDDHKQAAAAVDPNTYFDKTLARVSKLINARQHIRMAFNVVQNNSKFNIQAAGAVSSDALYMDEAVRYVLLPRKNIDENAIRKFWKFLASQQYDSESIKRDIKHGLTGNIALNIDDKEAFMALVEFVKATELRSSSFNVGLPFYYWPEYQTMDDFDANRNSGNLNDHGGYKISELFVPQRHANFKEEIRNYKFIDMDAYETTMVKVNAFMATESVKALKACTEIKGSITFIVLQYGIQHGDPILPRHLLSLFFYTDFTDLCTDFSATFRAIKQFEQLSSIKARNSKYWWMAKSLREMVELYGVARRRDRGGLKGPFYCGISAVMPFPEFEVRLCGPTSTSKQIETAINFATRKGVVVQLKNNVAYHLYLSGFACGWLSDFKEEDEVLFMGGHFRIKIESVRILRGKGGECQNFEVFFGALSKLNAMFNGSCAWDVSSDEKLIIVSLINWILGKKEADKIDRYVRDTFQSFSQNKAHIVFNYYMLCGWNDKELLDLIFYGMKMGADFKPAKEEKTNIFRKQVFQIFQNIKKIDIYATSEIGSDPCALSFAALLSEIEKEHWSELTVKGVHRKGNKSWVGVLWSQSSKELEQNYKKKGLQITFRNEKNEDGYDVDCVVIRK
eukprot:859586_1